MTNFYIETFGCQMNKSDSDLMHSSLLNEGFAPVKDIHYADIILYNTCSVRQHAENRVLSRIRSLGGNIKNNSIIVVAGCMAQRIGEKLIKDDIAALVIGPYQVPSSGNIIKQYIENPENNLHISQTEDNFSERIPELSGIRHENSSWHSWVTITHGCENFCTYCIVPFVRGKLISSDSVNILEYIKNLALNGIREVTLLGQNVNQFGTDTGDIPFYRLLEKVAEIDGLIRINFTTSHPRDFTGDIVRVIKEHKNISRSIHLPLQSGSDRVLKLMNRKYDRSHYLGIIDFIKHELADHSITTDLMVGFPGETHEDYQDTLSFINSIQFDDAFMYAYSPRENTPAYSLNELITREEKIERLNTLIEIQKDISRLKLSARINNTEKMIVEKISKRSGHEVMGKTFLNHPVVLPGTEKDIGKDLLIKIDSINGSTLQGTRIA